MYYAMGFMDSAHSSTLSSMTAQLQIPLTMHPVLVVSKETSQFEIFLIAKQQHDESTWEKAISSLGMLHTQTAMLFEDEDGQSCMERLIAKQMLLNGSEYHIDEVFLDAYRIASHGLMHFLDTRIWTMKKGNIRRLHQLQNQVNVDIEYKTQKRFQITRQIMVQYLVSEHAKILCDSDPIKYNALSPMISEIPSMDIQKLEDEEMELISDLDTLYQKSGQILSILKRQVDFQDMLGLDVAAAASTNIHPRSQTMF